MQRIIEEKVRYCSLQLSQLAREQLGITFIEVLHKVESSSKHANGPDFMETG